MKRTNIRVHRNGGSKSTPSQVPTNTDAVSAPNGTEAEIQIGKIKAFNYGLGFGFIQISRALVKSPKRKASEPLLLFTKGDLKYDPYRLNEGDPVSFVVTEKHGKLTATKVRVLESQAENCDAGNPVSVMFQVPYGTMIGGFTMTDKQWARLDSIAASWAEAKDEQRPGMAGFIEDAIQEKIERTESTTASPAIDQDAKPASLLFLTGMDDNMEEVAGWDYSAAEFAEIQRVATNSKQTLAEFLRSAIDARLKRGELVGDLEQAIDQTQALHALLEHQVLKPEEGEHNEDIKNGIVLLGIASFDRLDAVLLQLANPALTKE